MNWVSRMLSGFYQNKVFTSREKDTKVSIVFTKRQNSVNGSQAVIDDKAQVVEW